MSLRAISRKEFLRLGVVAGAGALVAACGAPPSPTAAPQSAKPGDTPKPAAAATQAPAAPTAAAKPADAAKPAATAPSAAKPVVQYNTLATTVPTKFNEPPMLADLVKAGTLPPVEKRIPLEPLVIKPVEIGTYGGTIRTGELVAGNMRGTDQKELGAIYRQNFLRINPDLNGYVVGAAVAKDLKISDDKSTYTITLRKGHKWSTGEPLTSKDFMFWYEDILQNKDLQPSIPPAFRPGGKLFEVTAPDDQTIVMKFSVPYPVWPLTYLSHSATWYKNMALQPAHFLKTFHPKYTPTAEADAKAAKYESWYARFGDMADPVKSKDLPTLCGFVIKETRVTGVRQERNPYYYAVDTEGNQLPYVDAHEMEYVSNVEMYNAKIVTGTFDWAALSTTILNYSAYESGAKAGNYNVLLWNTGKGGEVYYNVNMTDKDPVLRKIHQDVRYRRALSLAINRDEMNQLLFFGKAIPRQMTVLRSSKYFKPEYETSWAQYDPAKANALLDEMGLKWDAQKKYRLRPDGQPLQYNFSYYEGEGPKTPVNELVTEYWRKLGIQIATKVVTRQLLSPRILGNDESMSMWHGDASTDILLPQDRKWSSAKYGDESTMAPLWANWYESGGKAGEEPPDWFKPVFDAFTRYKDTLAADAADKLLSLQAENVWSIGTVGEAPLPIILRSNLRNFPSYGINVWDGNASWPFFTECVYFKK